MGSPPAWVRTADRRLAAAVASSGGTVLSSHEDPVDPSGVGILDLRGHAIDALRPLVAAGAAVVVVVASLDEAEAALSAGALDFALGDAPVEEVVVRARVAARPRGAGERGQRLRKLVRHDMRGPLAVLLGQCEILGMELGGPLSDRQRKSVAAMERKAQQLREMVDEVGVEVGALLGWEMPQP